MAFLIALLLSFSAEAFVLYSPTYRLSHPDDTVVYVSSDSNCTHFSNEALGEKVQVAIDRYWNTVTQSRLKLRYGGISSLPMDVAAPSGAIVVGCGSSSGGGHASLSESSGSAIVTINSGVSYSANGREGIIRIIAHELGHGIGLHHSDDPRSIMTYRTDRSWSLSPAFLSQDDKDGVIYLYPNEKELGGLVGACSSIDLQGPPPPPSGPWTILLLSLTLIVGLKARFKLER